MKTYKVSLFVIAALLFGGFIMANAGDGAAAKKSAADLEKEKALSNPYPNDYGPDKLDAETLKSYPPDKVKGYNFLLTRCAQCHTPSRPLNSRFVEPDAGKVASAERDAKETAILATMKKEHSEYFKDPEVWQVEAGIWNRYVKRMLNKPGCGIAAGGHMTNDEARQIFEFLVYDGQRRKLGENAEKWKAHRQGLIEKLKNDPRLAKSASNPKVTARYEELAKDKDL